MAFGLNRWIAYVALCLVVAAAWALPPRRYGRNYRPSWQTPERAHAVRLRDEIGQLDRHYQRLLRRDSLASMARAAQAAGRGYVFGASGSHDADSLRMLEEAYVKEVARAAGGEPKVVAGLYLYHPREWSLPGLKEDGRAIPVYSSSYQEFYAGSEGGVPYCIQAYPIQWQLRSTYRDLVPGPYLEAAGGDNDMLGPCAFHLRYGHPGEAVFRWLRDGGYLFAQERSSLEDEVRKQLDAYAQLLDFNGAFGLRMAFRSLSVDAEACLAGDVQACERSIFDVSNPLGEGRPFYAARLGIPASQVDMPVAYFDRRWYWGAYSGFDRSLLAGLESEFGPERFESFWTSEGELSEAFHSAFGVEPGEWVMGWARERLGEIDTSPAVPLRASALSLLVMGLLAALVGVVSQRRVAGR